MANRPNTNRLATLSRIARNHLQVSRLVERGNEALDIHCVHVVSLREALSAAFEAGVQFEKVKSLIVAGEVTDAAFQAGRRHERHKYYVANVFPHIADGC